MTQCAHRVLDWRLALLPCLFATPARAEFGEQQWKFTQSDAALGESFGFAVDLSGNTALVGVYADDDAGAFSGSAYLFDTTNGQQRSKLTASDAAIGDRFGRAVALSGNTAVVGAYTHDHAGFHSGAAYVFDVATGQQLHKLTPSDAAVYDHFGRSVDVSGTTAIIGAPNDDAGVGSAYLFDVTTGQQLRKLNAPSTMSDVFGESVAISGNLALVGTPRDGNPRAERGAAYLFDITTGQQLLRLTAADGGLGDEFGFSVSLAGNLALVGARYHNAPGADSGAAYLFDVTTGQQIHKLTASDAAAGDLFGYSVALNGNLAAVGSPSDDDDGSSSGSTYLFDVTTGEQLLKLTAPDAAAGDVFGVSVALGRRNLIVGASFNLNFGPSSGAAYLFSTVPEPGTLALAVLAIFVAAGLKGKRGHH